MVLCSQKVKFAEQALFLRLMLVLVSQKLLFYWEIPYND